MKLTFLEKTVVGCIGFMIVAMMVLCWVNSSYAEIETNWNELTGIHSGTEVNYNTGNKTWYPVYFYFDGMANSADGGRRGVRSVLLLGTPQNTMFDLDSVEGQKEWYQALPDILKPVAKDLRLQATAEDLSN